jgi:hypothetical protein
MGTSSARRGPTTALWRVAKGTATRYLSPAGGGEVTAREVVARYLAAMQETPGQGNRLAAWRFIRKVAQDLGAFQQEVNARGWEQALQDRGLEALASSPPEVLVIGLSGVLVGFGGGLEEAVAQTALALLLPQSMQSEVGRKPGGIVRQFISTALYLRLALDLGESLEAAANSYRQMTDGLHRIKAGIDTAGPETSGVDDAPATPVQWQGLSGWNWVTARLSALMNRFA